MNRRTIALGLAVAIILTFTLAMIGAAGATPPPSRPAAPQIDAQTPPPLIVVLPSGCIRIHPDMEDLEVLPWQHYQFPDGTGQWYAIKAPQPHEFVGIVSYPHYSYYYNAPAVWWSLDSQITRARHCESSTGLTQ